MAGSSLARTAEASRRVEAADQQPSLAANLLDKIGNVRYAFRVAEISSSLAGPDGKPRLFETLANNLPREPRRRSDFLNDIAGNPLKRLDSQK
jgi:hypothetical protein